MGAGTAMAFATTTGRSRKVAATSDEGAGIEVVGGNRSHDVVSTVDDRYGSVGVLTHDASGVIDGIFERQGHRGIHDVLEFVGRLSVEERMLRHQPKKPSLLGDNQVMSVRQLHGICGSHVGAESDWWLHDLVDTGGGVVHHDGPARGLGLDVGAGSEELALGPGSTGCADDEECSHRQCCNHRSRIGDKHWLGVKVLDVGSKIVEHVHGPGAFADVSICTNGQRRYPELLREALCDGSRQR